MNKNSSQSMIQKHKKIINTLGIILMITIPLILISYAYVDHYVSSQKVSFDSEISNDSTYVKDFLSIDEINSFDLDINWTVFSTPSLNESDELSGGYLTFEIFYTPNPNISVSQVTITPVLQTDWADVRVVGESKTISTSIQTEFKIDFNYRLPIQPLYFITVNEPVLYLKITYLQALGQVTVPNTVYVRYELDLVYPDQIFQ